MILAPDINIQTYLLTYLLTLRTVSRKLTDAVCGGSDDGGRRAGSTTLLLAKVKPVADDSVLQIIVLVADVDSGE